MVGRFVGHQQQPVVWEELEQVVEVAEVLGAGGVREDLVEAFAGAHVDGAEEPAGDGAAGRGDAGLLAHHVVVAAPVGAQAQLRLVLKEQPHALACELARPRAFPSASIRWRFTS